MTAADAGLSAQILTMLVIAQYLPGIRADKDTHWAIVGSHAFAAVATVAVVIALGLAAISGDETAAHFRGLTVFAYCAIFTSILFAQIEHTADRWHQQQPGNRPNDV